MQLSSERITIRLTPDQVEALDTIVLNQTFNNRSHALRVAIENFIKEQTSAVRGVKVVIEVPRMVMIRIENFIDYGWLEDRHKFISEAIREYMITYENKYIKSYTQSKELLKEASEDFNLKEARKEIEKR
ncbi:MAG: hypothetical protein KAJ51_09675 [Thermoplasmata archaeon]|nr:hypothetical protein [Thermoplasmata archaeon]